jgi:hypothetical protein
MTTTTQLPIVLTVTDLGAMHPFTRPLLVGIVAAQNMGQRVEASLVYAKQTATKPRRAGEDYVGLPGVGPQVLLGPVEAFRTLKGDLRFRIVTPMRSNGESNGWATLIPAGITAAAVVRLSPRVSA